MTRFLMIGISLETDNARVL